MKKSVLLILIVMGLVAGCNTMAGVGKDIQKAGETVEGAATKK